MIKKFLKQNPENLKWLISFYIVAGFVIMLLTIKI